MGLLNHLSFQNPGPAGDPQRHPSPHRQGIEFGRDILPALVHQCRVFGYVFSGYWGYTRTLDEYWQTHMDLFGADSKINLKEWQIRTNLEHERIQERQPAMIGPQAHLDQVLLTHGCVVEGTVKRSVLFPGVQVEEGAVVEDSILFFDTIVEAGAMVKKVITDKRVRIGEKARIGGGSPALPNQSFSPFAVFRADGHRTKYAPSLPDSSRGQLYPLSLLGREFF